MMNPEQNPPVPTKGVSLTEIRLMYLRGEISWETYQVYERALTFRFGDDFQSRKQVHKPAEQKQEAELVAEPA